MWITVTYLCRPEVLEQNELIFISELFIRDFRCSLIKSHIFCWSQYWIGTAQQYTVLHYSIFLFTPQHSCPAPSVFDLCSSAPPSRRAASTSSRWMTGIMRRLLRESMIHVCVRLRLSVRVEVRQLNEPVITHTHSGTGSLFIKLSLPGTLLCQCM